MKTNQLQNNTIFKSIKSTIEEARNRTKQSINHIMTEAYWHIGRLIVEEEQNGSERAAYGEGIQRVESFPISELAFREALINAVVHKDYSSQNSIQISVYDDKLLMWNAGDLPQNWTIDTLLRKHTSEPHNPLVAYPFFLAGYIESWGRGIEKIIEESQKFNGITPQFRWENGLWVEFYFNTDKSSPNGLGEKLGEKLGETQQNIIKLMQNNPKIPITALANELGISTTAIEKHIKTLKEQNIIKRIGGAKGGHWEILK